MKPRCRAPLWSLLLVLLLAGCGTKGDLVLPDPAVPPADPPPAAKAGD